MQDKLEFQVSERPQIVTWRPGRESAGECGVSLTDEIAPCSELAPLIADTPRIAAPRQANRLVGRRCLAARIESAALRPDADDRDELTGLPHLTAVSGLIRRLISEAESRRQSLAVVAFELDNFQLLCEEHGRSVGDEFLKSIASIMASVSCPHAVVVRHADQGFTTVLAGLSSAAETAICVQQVLDAIATPRQSGHTASRLTASAGIAMFPNDGANFDTLSRNARGAMRESKVHCPGTLRFHAGNLGISAGRRLRLEVDLRRAIQNNELTLFYQPQFEISSGRACGVEVLARWFRAHKAVEPNIFIPLAERTQLIATLGSWVLQEACTSALAWRIRGAKAITLCVNVSPQQLDEAFPSVVQHILKTTRFSPERLELEITENALVGNGEFIVQCFHRLKAIGVRIAIDDFGAGYSSLGYLSRLPVDRLKLDKSLIHNLTTQWKDVAILRAIIAMGRELGVDVIAEGVETEQQLQLLQQLGCPQAQGYLLGHPTPHNEAHAMLARRWGSRPKRRRAPMGTIPRCLHAS